MTEDGLRNLSGATSLQILFLSGVPLTNQDLPLLQAIPNLERLEIKGSGFLDEDVHALVKISFSEGRAAAEDRGSLVVRS